MHPSCWALVYHLLGDAPSLCSGRRVCRAFHDILRDPNGSLAWRNASLNLRDLESRDFLHKESLRAVERYLQIIDLPIRHLGPGYISPYATGTLLRNYRPTLMALSMRVNSAGIFWAPLIQQCTALRTLSLEDAAISAEQQEELLVMFESRHLPLLQTLKISSFLLQEALVTRAARCLLLDRPALQSLEVKLPHQESLQHFLAGVGGQSPVRSLDILLSYPRDVNSPAPLVVTQFPHLTYLAVEQSQYNVPGVLTGVVQSAAATLRCVLCEKINLREPPSEWLAPLMALHTLNVSIRDDPSTHDCCLDTIRVIGSLRRLHRLHVRVLVADAQELSHKPDDAITREMLRAAAQLPRLTYLELGGHLQWKGTCGLWQTVAPRLRTLVLSTIRCVEEISAHANQFLRNGGLSAGCWRLEWVDIHVAEWSDVDSQHILRARGRMPWVKRWAVTQVKVKGVKDSQQRGFIAAEDMPHGLWVKSVKI
jgi:hypothetical protein